MLARAGVRHTELDIHDVGLCAIPWVRRGPSLSCSSVTFPSRGPKRSRDSRVVGEEAIDRLEADDFDM